MKLELNIESFMETEAGQEIAKDALAEAFKEQARQYFAKGNEHAISNLAFFAVQKLMGDELETMRPLIEKEVRDRVYSGRVTEYVGQHEGVKKIITDSIRENTEAIKSKVVDYLEDEDTYRNFEYTIAEALIKSLGGNPK